MQTLLDDLQRLTPSQGALLYRLVDLGYLAQAQVDALINRLVSDRFAKARAYLRFAQHLDPGVSLNQAHIISRCYYAMYHAARALVLHVRRADVDDHEHLPVVLGRVIGTDYGDILGQWRELRNWVDYSPYLPADLASQATTALSDAAALLAVCRNELQKRGVNL
jgi:uncharacterized protein (UPF0332 family)